MPKGSTDRNLVGGICARAEDRCREPRRHLRLLPRGALPVLPRLEVHLRERLRSPVPAGGLRRHRSLRSRGSRQTHDTIRREAEGQELPRARLRPLRISFLPQGKSRLPSRLFLFLGYYINVMKFAVYILYSPKKKNLYIGQTSNLYKRLGSHFAGKVKTTKNRLPLILILQEYYRNRSEASKRERFLKSLWGVREKKRILAEYLKKRQKVV